MGPSHLRVGVGRCQTHSKTVGQVGQSRVSKEGTNIEASFSVQRVYRLLGAQKSGLRSTGDRFRRPRYEK